ncbi:MAG: FecCD family ABC transporter permease [Cellulosilyticaceae bacterium]
MRKKECLLSLIAVMLVIISVGIGRYHLTFSEVIQALLGIGAEERVHTLVYQIRLPRIVMVGLSGMALGLSGLVYQKLFRNPLVSPDLLGASSGASLGAAVGIVLGGQISGSVAVSAFGGSLLAVGMTLYLARYVRGATLGLVLAGIVTTALSGSLLMMVKVLADPYKSLPTIEFWLMGGFYNASWKGIAVVMLCVIVGAGICFVLAFQLKLLTVGDEVVKTLGMPVKVMRYSLIGAATLLVASVIAMNGLVSWIGLLAPHVARLYIGKRTTATIYGEMRMCMAWGGIILLVADTLCRTLFPIELPISVMTSLMGGILLGCLLIKQHKEQ